MHNLLVKFSQWYLNKQRNAQQKKQINKQDQTTIKVYNDLKQLYTFVKWLNTKGLPNRHERKAFWSKVRNNEPILETTLQNLINNYAKRINKTKVIKVENKQGEK